MVANKTQQQMTRKRYRHTLMYKVADFLTAMAAWATFFMYRKSVEGVDWSWAIFEDINFWSGIFVVPMGWILFYSIFDQYKDIYRISRLAALGRTFFLTFLLLLEIYEEARAPAIQQDRVRAQGHRFAP